MNSNSRSYTRQGLIHGIDPTKRETLLYSFRVISPAIARDFEVPMDRGAERVDELAPAAYDRHVGDDPPNEIADMVAALPSMSETLIELVDAMATAETQTLIVDLRDNPGGDS